MCRPSISTICIHSVLPVPADLNIWLPTTVRRHCFDVVAVRPCSIYRDIDISPSSTVCWLRLPRTDKHKLHPNHKHVTSPCQGHWPHSIFFIGSDSKITEAEAQNHLELCQEKPEELKPGREPVSTSDCTITVHSLRNKTGHICLKIHVYNVGDRLCHLDSEFALNICYSKSAIKSSANVRGRTVNIYWVLHLDRIIRHIWPWQCISSFTAQIKQTRLPADRCNSGAAWWPTRWDLFYCSRRMWGVLETLQDEECKTEQNVNVFELSEHSCIVSTYNISNTSAYAKVHNAYDWLSWVLLINVDKRTTLLSSIRPLLHPVSSPTYIFIDPKPTLTLSSSWNMYALALTFYGFFFLPYWT